MSSFLRKQNSRSKAVDNVPVVMLPLQEHRKSEHLSIVLMLALAIKQNKFNIEHGEYEYSPYYPIIGALEYYRVKFLDGRVLYEVTRETTTQNDYGVKICTPTQNLYYDSKQPFTYAQLLFELTASGRLSLDSKQKLAKFGQDGQVLHYLASLMVPQK